MNNNLNLFATVSGFVIAIFISSFYKIGFSFFLFLILLSIAIFVYRKFSTNESSKRKIFLMVIFIFSFALGVLRYEIRDLKNLDVNLENNIGQKVLIEGIISDEPAKKEFQTSLIVDFKDLIISGSSTKVFGKGIISTNQLDDFKYGDLVQIEGKIVKPVNFVSTSSPDFDYVSYLEKDNILYEISFANVTFVSAGHGNPIKSFLFLIKDKFMENIGKVIPKPEDPLLGGILLGSKSAIDTNTSNIFRIAGLSHIVALSGYNITVVAKFISDMLSFLPKTYSLYGGIFGIILFILMTGASSTAIRAGIMALIAILGKMTRRGYSPGRALIVAAFLMILVNPKILVYDISFQLSFLATVAIIYVAPILKNKLKFVTEKFMIQDTLASTLSAQILVLPLILNKMGLLSLVALPSNILILPFMPYTMFFGFITGMLGFISIYFAFPFAWISYALLLYMIKVATFFAGLPFSSVQINWFSPFIMSMCYVFITIWIVHMYKREAIHNK